MYKYELVALGGTFDRLHQGHKQLLQKAFEISGLVVIGVTSNEFIKDKTLSKLVQPYSSREKDLIQYLQQQGYNDRFEIIKLDDIYGTTITDAKIQAVVVSKQTVKGAKLINRRRVQLGLEALAVEVTSMVSDDSGAYISSTRLRQGQINRQGEVYVSLFHNDYQINEAQRQVLSHPTEELVELESFNFSGFTKIAVVGDVSLARFISLKKPFNFGVYDNISGKQKMRGAYEFESLPRFSAENPAGQITSQSVTVMRHLLTMDRGLLEIEGEEDLLVLPMIMLLPLHSLVFYGQPDKGLVAVPVTERTKQDWFEFLKSKA